MFSGKACLMLLRNTSQDGAVSMLSGAFRSFELSLHVCYCYYFENREAFHREEEAQHYLNTRQIQEN